MGVLRRHGGDRRFLRLAARRCSATDCCVLGRPNRDDLPHDRRGEWLVWREADRPLPPRDRASAGALPPLKLTRYPPCGPMPPPSSTRSTQSTQSHPIARPWLSTWLSNGPPAPTRTPCAARSERGKLEGRLGFEPRTRGLKVSPAAIHGVSPSPSVSAAGASPVDGLHDVPRISTAVAVNVAVSANDRWSTLRGKVAASLGKHPSPPTPASTPPAQAEPRQRGRGPSPSEPVGLHVHRRRGLRQRIHVIRD